MFEYGKIHKQLVQCYLIEIFDKTLIEFQPNNTHFFCGFLHEFFLLVDSQQQQENDLAIHKLNESKRVFEQKIASNSCCDSEPELNKLNVICISCLICVFVRGF